MINFVNSNARFANAFGRDEEIISEYCAPFERKHTTTSDLKLWFVRVFAVLMVSLVLPFERLLAAVEIDGMVTRVMANHNRVARTAAYQHTVPRLRLDISAFAHLHLILPCRMGS